MSRYLYRGFGVGTYPSTAAAMSPKKPGKFNYIFRYDGSIFFDGSATYGSSTQNAVLRHQLDQAGFPTAGVSTTPHLERAVFYALGGGWHQKGIIIIIDRELLKRYGITEFVVSDTVTHPSAPNDDEVILVSADGGPLPLEIIVSEIIIRA